MFRLGWFSGDMLVDPFGNESTESTENSGTGDMDSVHAHGESKLKSVSEAKYAIVCIHSVGTGWNMLELATLLRGRNFILKHQSSRPFDTYISLKTIPLRLLWNEV